MTAAPATGGPARFRDQTISVDGIDSGRNVNILSVSPRNRPVRQVLMHRSALFHS